MERPFEHHFFWETKRKEGNTEMRKKTIGLMMMLALSTHLANAQDVTAPEATSDDDRSVAEVEAVPPRPETTEAEVIADTLMKGEKMELTIRFKTNSDRIKGRAHKQILEIASALKGPELSGKRIGVQGHTDADGDDEYNLDLSYRRSVTVVRALVEMYGIEQKRLEVMGYGERNPIASNETDEGKALNRRVTLIALDLGEAPSE